MVNDEEMHTVASKLGDKWRPLGRKLQIDDVDLDSINQEETKLEEKGIRVLREWREREGHSAKKKLLYDALISSKLRWAAEECFSCLAQQPYETPTSD